VVVVGSSVVVVVGATVVVVGAAVVVVVTTLGGGRSSTSTIQLPLTHNTSDAFSTTDFSLLIRELKKELVALPLVLLGKV
jgi:hypothetical protein